MTTLIQAIVRTVDWKNTSSGDWYDRASWRLDKLLNKLPHGSGIDGPTEIIDYQTDRNGMCKSISFRSDFHHMDEHGGYDGWTEHIVKVCPDWSGFRIRISGRNRNQIKDYLSEVWEYTLSQTIEIPCNW